MPSKISVDAVCCLIDARLRKGNPVIDEVARSLRVSPRTLQRLLNEERVSNSDLVGRCRCQTACASLELTRDPIQDIAAKLGYRWDPGHPEFDSMAVHYVGV